MGWLFKPGSTRKGLISERTTCWERITQDGLTIRSSCIAHCFRGGSFSAVLWTVWEQSFQKDGQQARPTERWIGCDLLEYSKRHEGWGYKDMEESMGPYFFSCPLKYLEMVPVVASESWREGVRSYHQRQKEKRLARKQKKIAEVGMPGNRLLTNHHGELQIRWHEPVELGDGRVLTVDILQSGVLLASFENMIQVLRWVQKLGGVAPLA